MCVFAVNARKYILQPNNEVQAAIQKKVSKMLQVMSVVFKTRMQRIICLDIKSLTLLYRYSFSPMIDPKI